MHSKFVVFVLLIKILESSRVEEPPRPEDQLNVAGIKNDLNEQYLRETCRLPVGLESSYLFDESFSASSYYDEETRPRYAKLNSMSSWRPEIDNENQWLVINLNRIYKLTGISTQGYPRNNFFVTLFRLELSENGKDYYEYAVGGVPQLFTANMNSYTIVKTEFAFPQIVQYLRIIPLEWTQHIALRVEVYGCFFSASVVQFTKRELIYVDLNQVDDKAPFTDLKNVSFRFKTERGSGLIFQSQGPTGDYIAAQLKGGKFVLNINLGSNSYFNGATSIVVGKVLSDNMWHTITIDLDGRRVTIVLDGVSKTFFTNGQFTRLDLGDRITFGGTDYHQYKGIDVNLNFRGCLENIIFGGINIISSFQNGRLGFDKMGILNFQCLPPEHVPTTISSYNQYFEFTLTQQILKAEALSISFNFRTWDETGIIMYSPLQEGNLFIGVYQGSLYVNIVGNENSPGFVVIGEGMNNGNWRRVAITIKRNFATIIIDGQVYPINKFIAVKPSTKYFIAGSYRGSEDLKVTLGFIGCLRKIYVNNVYLDFQKVISKRTYTSDEFTATVYGGPRIDACDIIDRCSPNPCFHKGVCFQDFNDFHCDCSMTGYRGDDLCHATTNLPSCQSYRFLNGTSGTKYIDVDLAGPLPHFLVYCNIDSEELGELEYIVNPRTNIKVAMVDPSTYMSNGDVSVTLSTIKYDSQCTSDRYFYCEGITDKEHYNNGASFQHRRSAMFFPPVNGARALEIFFYFRTRKPKGVFMMFSGRNPNRKYNYPRQRDRMGEFFYIPDGYSDFVTVHLTDAQTLTLSFRVGNQDHSVFAKFPKGREISDGEWHQVHIAYTIKDARITLDGVQYPGIFEPHVFGYEELSLDEQVVVGSDVTQNNGFVGCMRSLIINGVLQDLQGRATLRPGWMVKPGCVGRCDNKPCRNNGICYEHWDSFFCDCHESGFGGYICTNDIGASFSEHSFLQYTIPPKERMYYTIDTIRLGFSTKERTGLLLLVMSQDGSQYIRVEMISSGGIQVIYNLDGRDNFLIDENNYINNEFHDVLINRKERTVTLRVDSYPTVVRTFNAMTDFQFRNPATIFVGNQDTTQTGFIGCISRVRYNEIPPLKRAFEPSTSADARTNIADINDCKQIPATLPDFVRPPFFLNWPNETYALPSGKLTDFNEREIDRNIIIGICVIAVLAFVIIAFIVYKIFSRQGVYHTHEQPSSNFMMDNDTAIRYSELTGKIPNATTDNEIFL